MPEGDIQDLRTDMYDGFWEKTTVDKDDIEMISDAEALWQAIEGEIKTPYGVIDGVGLETYGCRIWNLLGSPLDGLLLREAESHIRDIQDKYEEVNLFTKIRVIPYGRAYVKIEVDVDSIYGRFTGVSHIAMDIINSFTTREKPNIISRGV